MKVEDDQSRDVLHKVSLDAKVLCLQYHEGRVYAGLKNGTLVVFYRDLGHNSIFRVKKIMKETTDL